MVGMSRSRFRWRRARVLGEEVGPGSRNGEGAIENRVEGRFLPYQVIEERQKKGC